jgi:hypothetical protein
MTTATRHATTVASRPARNWRTAAACQGVDLDTLFSDANRTQERIQGICRGCPVRLTCLRDALGGVSWAV